MDPNATLDEIRHLVSKSKVVYLDDHETMRLVELVEGLDNWLNNGGFLPTAWLFKGRDREPLV